MQSLPVLLLVTATLCGVTASERAPRGEIGNVAAFARVYGVVRYFYPSDSTASLDWDRFAVHGVRRVRAARDARVLETTLDALFSPLGPGIMISAKLPTASSGKPDDTLIAWRYLGPGIAALGPTGPYRAKRTHRPAAVGMDMSFVSLSQTVPALDLRGKRIRLRGQVRASVRGTDGFAGLWLRVVRPNRAAGFFDDMRDRPIRQSDWRGYTIEGPLADDAINVAFGTMAFGRVTADFDAIDLTVLDAEGRWTEVKIKDPGFEAAADGGEWTVSSKLATITRPAGEAPEGRQFLRVAPAPAPPSDVELFDGATPIDGAHVDVDLGSGLKARVPLALSETQARAEVSGSSRLDALRAAIELVQASRSSLDVDTRLADVVVAWNVFRHFYPYWTEAGVDWDARLQPQLEAAYLADTREAHHEALRALVADARDGHGRVADEHRAGEVRVLPIQLGIIGDRLVVMASDTPASAPVGAVVSAIEGVPAGQRLAKAMRLSSGTTQWKQVRALQEITTCSGDAPITLTLDKGEGPYQSTLRCAAGWPPIEKRPEPIAELTPGVWYVDLTRASFAQVTEKLETLSHAAGVVFDVRGYPTDAGGRILPHLVDGTEQDRWMHVAKITGPFGQSVGWQSFGWDLKPSSPHLAGRTVFLTDGRAISYAESVMGYVADRKLGMIVGSTTAGTNGDVVRFAVPGGFSVGFTGMRVTRHDGRTQHHLVGVKPDIAVTPTLASIRAGRDEVLERATALIGGK